MLECSENFLPVTGGKIYYKKYFNSETSNKTPLIVIHGGPGFCHYYLESLHRLANEREVIFYDQLGCGRSDRPEGKSLFIKDRFSEELRLLIEHLGYAKVNLLGHSWGALLAAEYAISCDKVSHLILASPYLSYKLWMGDAGSNFKKLSDSHQSAINKAVVENNFTSEAFNSALNEYNARFVYGTRELPSAMQRSAEEAGRESYLEMWGPCEFVINGNLKNYEGAEKLKAIKAKTLFTCGKHDEASPKSCQILSREISDSKVVTFQDSAHIPHLTETEEYLRVVREFLRDEGTNRRWWSFLRG